MKRLALLLGLGAIALMGASAPALAQCPGVNCTLPAQIDVPMQLRTYGIGVRNLVATSSATDVFGICGSATKTVRVTKLGIAGRATTASIADALVAKRSTANSGGTSTVLTPAAYDSENGSPTAVVRAYTDNPTVGTLVGYVAGGQMFLGNLSTTVGYGLQWIFGGNSPAQNVTLRGTSQCVYLNLGASSFSGNTFDTLLEWTEE